MVCFSGWCVVRRSAFSNIEPYVSRFRLMKQAQISRYNISTVGKVQLVDLSFAALLLNNNIVIQQCTVVIPVCYSQ